MLCDELIAGGAPGSGCDIASILPRLQRAQKFVLGPEFAAVADALSSDYTGLVKAFPHCRLPFAHTWIELAHLDRPQFAAAEMHVEVFQTRPKRVGFLLSATRPDLSAWKAHLLWSADRGCSCAGLAMKFDMVQSLAPRALLPTAEDEAEQRASYRLLSPHLKNHPGWSSADASVKLAMMRHTATALPDYGTIPPPLGLDPAKLAEFYEMLGELARSDWAGEAGYILAVIGLLNARNVVEAQAVDHGKLNAARVRRGRAPLFEYKLLKIANRHYNRAYGATGRHGDYAPMRGHFVRGHFKVRRSGIFFWHPHARGSFQRGKINKVYTTA